MFKLFKRSGHEDLSESPALDEFFDRLMHLNAAAFLAMAAEWHGIPERDLRAASRKVGVVARAEGLEREIEKVRDRAFHWANHSEIGPYMGLVGFAASESGLDDARHAAASAIVDAAVAVALGDRLAPETRELLLRPWHRVLDASIPAAPSHRHRGERR